MPYLFTHEDKAERERLAAIEAGLDPFTIEWPAKPLPDCFVAARLKPLFEEEARQRQRAALKRGSEPPVGPNLAQRGKHETMANRPKRRPWQ